MARQVLFLALVLFAVIGMAAAAATDPVATSPSASDDDVVGAVGNDDGDSDAAPVGGPVPNGVFSPTATTTDAPAPTPKGGAAALEISAVGGVAAAVAAFFF